MSTKGIVPTHPLAVSLCLPLSEFVIARLRNRLFLYPVSRTLPPSVQSPPTLPAPFAHPRRELHGRCVGRLHSNALTAYRCVHCMRTVGAWSVAHSLHGLHPRGYTLALDMPLIRIAPSTFLVRPCSIVPLHCVHCACPSWDSTAPTATMFRSPNQTHRLFLALVLGCRRCCMVNANHTRALSGKLCGVGSSECVDRSVQFSHVKPSLATSWWSLAVSFRLDWAADLVVCWSAPNPQPLTRPRTQSRTDVYRHTHKHTPTRSLSHSALHPLTPSLFHPLSN